MLSSIGDLAGQGHLVLILNVMLSFHSGLFYIAFLLIDHSEFS